MLRYNNLNTEHFFQFFVVVVLNMLEFLRGFHFCCPSLFLYRIGELPAVKREPEGTKYKNKIVVYTCSYRVQPINAFN